ncbi:hypothetical protein ACGFY6_20275 [Streptomyces sp. NPDC048387]|uniref:hypothetical protein n=1 Tax=Streptomyces sp. NPDC048387 TaxID=3365542 RepID=UPI00371EC84A
MTSERGAFRDAAAGARAYLPHLELDLEPELGSWLPTEPGSPSNGPHICLATAN